MKEESAVIVIGSGGHAKVVVATLLSAGMEVRHVFDDREMRWGEAILGVPIIGPISSVGEHENVRGIIGIGSNTVRKKLQEELNLSWASVIHPRAFVDPSVKMGVGSVIFAGAIVQPGVTIGNHVVVNTGASVDHDCILEDYAQVAPGVHVGGAVHVGEGAFLGIGSSIVQCLHIGKWSTVGAGSAVIRDVPDYATVVGVPGKVIKEKPCD
jgi:sugar O-acyltransferase (sialic acid O-acetyltransferase NeuD family)